jgi:glycine/D-amino acid oxidase-like deaminating enzyme
MFNEENHDVVIVGAGVNGCVVARELASDHDVLVLEEGQIASKTTAKASGLITNIYDYGEYPEATRYALDFFEAYDGTGHFSYTQKNFVELLDSDVIDERRREAKTYSDSGFDVSYLTIDEVRDKYPDAFVLDTVAGAIEYREGGRVDPYTFAMTLKEDAEAQGATFATGVTVEDILTEDDEVNGVQTTDGTVNAPTVIVAAGWHTRDLVCPYMDLPIRPYRAQTINLETEREFADDYPITLETSTHLYWCPEHSDELHVGGGAFFSADPPPVRSNITEEFRNFVAEAIHRYVPGTAQARIASEDICPTGMAGTPDGDPIYDEPEDGPEGLIVATGSNGQGIMAAPMAAACVRAIISDTEPPFSRDPFRVSRFESRTADFTSKHIPETPSQIDTELPEGGAR